MANREPVASEPRTRHSLRRRETADGDAAARLAGLASEIREREVILFVGAGVSAGLGLPTWEDFHGDLDDPSSMALAKTDYLDRLSFEQPLDIKLAADAHAVALFLDRLR